MPRSLVRAMAYVAKRSRLEAEVKQVRVAAFLNVDQSTIARFEKGGGWPEDLGRTLRAYEEAGVRSALEIGLEGFQLWDSVETLPDEIERFLAETDEQSSDDNL